MEKRYQVFVSSTFRDLQDERQEVMEALLELDCFPAGMELFPAANEDQWSLIKRVIDDSDYYLVVIGGRYGSLGPDGISYTEMEYRYAIEQGKPIISFLHKDPGTLPANRTEESPEGKHRLSAFRKLTEQKVVKYWSNALDLGSMVSRSLVRLLKDHPAVGWVRADQIPDESAIEDILRLRKRVDELQAQLRTAGTHAPDGSQSLAQGEDEFDIGFTFQAKAPGNTYDRECSARVSASWNEIFAAISPLMMDDASEYKLFLAINDFVDTAADSVGKQDEFNGHKLSKLQVNLEDFNTIKVQLRALGLITKSTRQRSVKNQNTYWTLTPYGEELLMRLRAIKKS